MELDDERRINLCHDISLDPGGLPVRLFLDEIPEILIESCISCSEVTAWARGGKYSRCAARIMGKDLEYLRISRAKTQNVDFSEAPM
eukprot:1333287-Amorphochlora_amoeboformis.AAC.2